uniref:Membrane spanning 4-domains A13 n=1 Tax=Suricata suricatta TaxID=37032 RepID=A0A673U257_SURSU
MIGIFHVLMWYFLLILYMGQIRGFFGTYEPVTYKAGCSLWGVIKLGREVSRILLLSYPLEISVALTHAIFSCMALTHHHEASLTAVPEELESTF